MTVESPNFVPLERAIPPDELLLANGEMANKKTLQEAAYKAGLPVPKILTEKEASMFLSEGSLREGQDFHAYHESRDDEKYRVYLRGYYPGEIDMWAVDILATTSVPREQYIPESVEELTSHAARIDISSYLLRHFRFSDTKSARFFLQQASPGVLYFSTLSFGPYTFCTANGESGRGVHWIAIKDSHVIYGDWGMSPRENVVLQLASEASKALNDALPRKSTDFAFKHDFLMQRRTSMFTLIQSRVASRIFTDADIQQQEKQIEHDLESGIRLIELEPFETGALTVGRSPKEPFILALTNDMHRGSMSYPECNNLDLSQMAGLILPQYMRGGLLAHDGYRFMAYALYWGLPISMTA
jgi:hypothetical protein